MQSSLVSSHLISLTSSPRNLSNLSCPLLLLLFPPNQLLNKTHRRLLLQPTQPILFLSATLPLLLLGLRINAMLSIAMVIHGGMLVEADRCETFGRVAEVF